MELRGTIITPSEVLADGVIATSGNRISQIKPGSQPQTAIDTASHIFPGLIDLHDLPRNQPGLMEED
jgi:dihydroorotase-like cyclic amidohydrolase